MLRAVRPTAECWHEAADQYDWQWTKREHDYDPISRLIKSTYKQWWDQEQEPSGDSVEHIYAGAQHLQNTDDGTNFGERWRTPHACPRWSLPVAAVSGEIATRLSRKVVNRSGAGTPSNDPPPLTHPRLRQSVEMTRPLRRRGAGLRAGRPTGEALARAGSSIQTPQRRTFSNPTTEDDQRNLYGQGKVMPKDSSGSGANWGTGIASDDPNGVLNPMNSRLDFDGTVAPTDLDRATDAREKARIGIFGSALAYAGSSPRVTSETIGRDINPLGRGSGMALVGGELNLGRIAPRLPLSRSAWGNGSSINNCSASCLTPTATSVTAVEEEQPPIGPVLPAPIDNDFCTWCCTELWDKGRKDWKIGVGIPLGCLGCNCGAITSPKECCCLASGGTPHDPVPVIERCHTFRVVIRKDERNPNSDESGEWVCHIKCCVVYTQVRKCSCNDPGAVPLGSNPGAAIGEAHCHTIDTEGPIEADLCLTYEHPPVSGSTWGEDDKTGEEYEEWLREVREEFEAYVMVCGG